jgi:hypothetical protein
MPTAMLLMWPMLDDRNETISAQQIDGVGIWDRTSNETGWMALLGDRRGTNDVSIYAATRGCSRQICSPTASRRSSTRTRKTPRKVSLRAG